MDRFNEISAQINTEILPKLAELTSGNTVLICVVGFIFIMMVIGYTRGLMRRILSVGSLILTLAAEAFVFPYVMEYLKTNTVMQEMIAGLIRGWMQDNSALAASPLYDILGFDVLAENAAELANIMAVRVLVFILIFIAVRILLFFVSGLITGAKSIKLIDGLDKWLGLAFGFAEGLMIVWIFMIAVSAFPGLSFCNYVLTQITESDILLGIYNNNVILMVMAGMLG
ncbi:MAG: CvpA family protein [Eubacteriales bacterium]|nr:CvpA family protein [Eubacteriales bacterium]